MLPGYRQFAPGAELAHLVDAFWLRNNAATDVEALILPDGCIDLVLRANASRRALFASALTTEPYRVSSRAGSWFVGVRFKPGMSRVVLDVPPAECRDEPVDATSFDASFGELSRRLGDVSSPERALALLEAEVLQRARAHAHRGPPPRVCQALAWLGSADPPRCRELARRLGVAERSLHRDLVAWTGLAPKVLGCILRMQRATQLIGCLPLADAALEAGYSDQSHMTRELRRLTGRCPSEHAPR